MRQTKYELRELRDTRTDKIIRVFCNLPMNTPLMLVRTRGNRLGFKRLRKGEHAPRIVAPVSPDQVSLL